MKRLFLLLALVGLSTGARAQSTIRHDSYIELNGRDQYMTVPHSPELALSEGGSYTFTMWVWGETTEAYSGGQYLLSKGLKSGGYQLVAYKSVASDFFGYNLSQGEGKDPLREWSAAPKPRAELRRWYHLALVLDRAQQRAYTYVDGVRTGSKPLPESVTLGNEAELRLGAGGSGDKLETPFMGRLDNVRLYARALSTKEIARDRQTEHISPKTQGLMMAFDFDGYLPGAQTITDVTGRHTARLFGYLARSERGMIHTYQTFHPNGNLIGRSGDQALGGFTLGVDKPVALEHLELNLEGTTDLKDVDALKLYITDSGDRFDPRRPGKLIGSIRPTGSIVRLEQSVKGEPITRHSKLWLVADVAPEATEGHWVTAQIKEIAVRRGGEQEAFRPQLDKRSYPLKQEVMAQEIVLERTLLFAPGDHGSASYRIPGIVRLSDGTLVASIDKRHNSNYDLPEDITVQVIRSTDNGKTWSAPIDVAVGSPDYGYGDAAMATDGETIHMVMVGGSGLWYYPSQAKAPLQMHYTRSTDGGKTWEAVRNISKEVYTDRFPNGGFFGSGNGLITRDGRIAFVAAMRVDEKWGGAMDNVMVYSDDKGQSWHASPVARRDGDEAKIQELADGRLIISSRNRQRYSDRTYVTSTDGGILWSAPQTWADLKGNACNAAFARYSLPEEGKTEGGILLHTLLEAEGRTNLTIFTSTDEAKTWGSPRVICRGEAAYSEIVILSDGTVGIISEENDRPAYDIYFTRVSLDWLTKKP